MWSVDIKFLLWKIFYIKRNRIKYVELYMLYIVNLVVVSWSEFIRMLSNVSFRSVAFLMREKKKYR